MNKTVKIYFENGSHHEILLKKYEDINMIVKGIPMEGNYKNKLIYFNKNQDSKEILPNETFEGINGNVVMVID